MYDNLAAGASQNRLYPAAAAVCRFLACLRQIQVVEM
jgi:hypothetical protein